MLKVDARQVDREIIAERLGRRVVKAKGLKAFEEIAGKYKSAQFSLQQTLRSEHRKSPVTRIVANDKCLFSSDKSGTIIKWSFCTADSKNPEEGWRKQHVFRAPSSILAMAVSPDRTALLAGLSNGQIMAWNAQTNKDLGVLGPNGHRDAVNSIAFQPASLTAFFRVF